MFALACGEIKVVHPVLGTVYNLAPSESANKFFIQSLDEDYTPKIKKEISGQMTLKTSIESLTDEELDKLTDELA